MLQADVAIVGAGAAGLSLAHRLARPAATVAGTRPRRLSVVLLEAPPGALRPPRRTWCFWEPEAGPYDAAVTASWRTLRDDAGLFTDFLAWTADVLDARSVSARCLVPGLH
ncbi:lycopene cyclase family protein, partial [Streptomyces poonensis]|uniref:lycopene cyclase family protein n=1 Tax=Streptomyces poonensis TaxID=68255 RepID=UPI0022F3395E